MKNDIRKSALTWLLVLFVLAPPAMARASGPLGIWATGNERIGGNPTKTEKTEWKKCLCAEWSNGEATHKRGFGPEPIFQPATLAGAVAICMHQKFGTKQERADEIANRWLYDDPDKGDDGLMVTDSECPTISKP